MPNYGVIENIIPSFMYLFLNVNGIIIRLMRKLMN